MAPMFRRKRDYERIERAGQQMSNLCFNLAQQKPGTPLDAAWITSMDRCRKEWDAAIEAARLKED